MYLNKTGLPTQNYTNKDEFFAALDKAIKAKKVLWIEVGDQIIQSLHEVLADQEAIRYHAYSQDGHPMPTPPSTRWTETNLAQYLDQSICIQRKNQAQKPYLCFQTRETVHRLNI
jgi:hypothetical protein